MFSPRDTVSAFDERLRAALAPDYELLRELASGGMGTVYLVRDVALDCPRAVKVLRPELWTAETARQFVNEARILAALRHPNIVAVHRVGHPDGLDCYLMDYLEGDTLRSRLEKQGRLSLAAARKLGRDLLEALEIAHANGVIHRDVKPANLFVEKGRGVLTDFGIARRLTDAERSDPGVAVGTAAYMAPEQFAGVEADARTDIYAAGMVIYEALTGRHWDKGPPEEGDWSGVPWLVSRVLRRSLALDPAARWPDAAAFRRALWHTRVRRYQRNAIGIGIGGVMLGLGLRAVVPPRLVPSPLRPASSVRLRVASSGLAPQGLGDSVACALARSLDRYTDLSSRCVAGWRRWWPSGSLVTAEAVGDGSAMRIQLHGERVDTIAIRGPATAWRALVDTLADRVFGAMLGSEGSLDASLPRSVLPKNAPARSAFRRAEKAFTQARYGVARAAYAEAAELDSTCWICYWRHAEVGRWFDLEDDPRDSTQYLAHVDSFPERYRRLIRAQWLPETARLESLDALTQRWRDFLFGQFRRGEEALHRGPLVGRSRREALQSFQDVLRVQAEFVPALGHLAWLYVAEGDSAPAAGALAQLEPLADATDASYGSIAVVELAFAWRFLPPQAARRATDRLVQLARAAGIRDLDAGARYLAGFGAPQGELAFAEQLQGDPRFEHSATLARILALVGMGRPQAAFSLASSRPELELFAGELAATQVLFDPDSTRARARWPEARTSLEAIATGTVWPIERRRRAAWMLATVERRPLLTGEPPSSELATFLRAQAAAARGAYDSALTLTDGLTQVAVQPTDDPFFRTVLHLARAAWRQRGPRPASAKADLIWHENSDVVGYPTRDPQPAEIDWAFAPVAQWMLGELLTQSGVGGEEACRAYRAVARLWADGEPNYRARADSAARRIVALGCEKAA
jgi:Protein kinase domain